FIPTTWLWQRWRKEKASFLHAEDWTLTLIGHKAGKPTTPYHTFQQIDNALQTVRRCLPRADLSKGTVLAPGMELRLPILVWDSRTVAPGGVRAEVEWPKQKLQATAQVEWAQPYELALQCASVGLRSVVTVSTTSSTRGPP